MKTFEQGYKSSIGIEIKLKAHKSFLKEVEIDFEKTFSFQVPHKK